MMSRNAPPELEAWPMAVKIGTVTIIKSTV